MKIFFSVGEPSGDLHGANLISELRQLDPSMELVGFGGPRMKAAGCQLLFDLTSMAVMLFTGIISKLPKFLALRKQAARYFREQRPDAVLLIDFPGFNWHIAKAARRAGIPVFYYGVPQMWAWAPWRIRKLQQNVDHVLCKLPFEPKWFRERDCQAEYVGHPYFDELSQRQLDQTFISSLRQGDQPILTLLPGSRHVEVARNIETQLKAAAEAEESIPGLRVFVAAFNSSQLDMINQQIARLDVNAEAFVGRTAELIEAAQCCVACSGSVSLELMYHHKPTVIVYRVSRFYHTMANLVLRSRFITLVNLIAAKRIDRDGRPLFDPDADGAERCPFPEYLTTQECSGRVARWLNRWYSDPEEFERRVSELQHLRSKYAKPGASRRAAAMVFKCLTENRPSDREIQAA